jgi:hypothetical protein
MARTMAFGWKDLDRDERRRRIMIFGGTAAGVVLIAAAAFGLVRGGGDAQAATAKASSTPTVRGDVTAWFEGTAEVRGEVMAAATAVRSYIDADDGLALQPACAGLGTQAGIAGRHPDAPEPGLQELWAGGAKSFGDAATWCAKLWDGTQMPPSAILSEVTGALDTAEARWEELATRVGQPLPPLPSGTFASSDGAGPAAPGATSTAAPARPAPAPRTTPPPSQGPGVTLPSITLPTFDSPPASPSKPPAVPPSPAPPAPVD